MLCHNSSPVVKSMSVIASSWSPRPNTCKTNLSKLSPVFVQTIYCKHKIEAESKHIHHVASDQQQSFELTACHISTMGGSHAAVAVPPAVCTAGTRPLPIWAHQPGEMAAEFSCKQLTPSVGTALVLSVCASKTTHRVHWHWAEIGWPEEGRNMASLQC